MHRQRGTGNSECRRRLVTPTAFAVPSHDMRGNVFSSIGSFFTGAIKTVVGAALGTSNPSITVNAPPPPPSVATDNTQKYLLYGGIGLVLLVLLFMVAKK